MKTEVLHLLPYEYSEHLRSESMICTDPYYVVYLYLKHICSGDVHDLQRCQFINFDILWSIIEYLKSEEKYPFPTSYGYK